MLCNLEENGKQKCVEYWDNVKKIDISVLFPSNFEIFYTTEKINDDIIIRTINIKNMNNEKEKTIKQIHYGSWPDHQSLDINKVYGNILFMFNLVDKEIDHSPIVVHCSAGVGRTGTVIAIYIILFCLEYLKKLGKPLIMNVFNVVRKLREQRYSLVTDTDQYQFIYDFSLDWIKKNYNNIVDNK